MKEKILFLGPEGRYHEECGVFAIYAPQRDVAHLTYYGLFALQHRGQEGCGIAVMDGASIRYKKDLGLVPEVFNERDMQALTGQLAIGHVRYSTTGDNTQVNTQPLVGQCQLGSIALAHNGNLANTDELRAELEKEGAIFQTSTDTEVVLHWLARCKGVPLHEAFLQIMKKLKGSYAFVALSDKKLTVARDLCGNRPLCLGRLGEGEYVVASESCALATVGATFIRDLDPGEVLVIDETGLHSYSALNGEKPRCAHCIFEYVYFARPDSTLDGINVNRARRKMGEILAREIAHLDVDRVIPVPDSGTTAAVGLAQEKGIPLTQGILKNRYAGRTFIQPTQALRELMVNLKLNPIEEEIRGLRIAVVDDSIVRGTTSRRLVTRLRERGAKEVHFCVVCPPVKYPCFYGIDTGERDTLIAATHDKDAICKAIGADSLHFISLEGLIEAVGGEPHFCTACLNGEYLMGKPSATCTPKTCCMRLKDQ